MTSVGESSNALLSYLADLAKTWLFEHALPLWAERGVDPAGAFHERLDLYANPTAHDRRAFVQARQIYSFIEAGALGWNGPWDRLARHGLNYLLANYARPQGGFAHTLSPMGHIVEGRAHLYDQAFVLFALANAKRVFGDSRYEQAANATLDFLEGTCRHHSGGFREEHGESFPLKQNPHMHLLEAALAWIEVSGDERWFSLASNLVELALRHFIDPGIGGLIEYFGESWEPYPTRALAIIEPGHQFEWAWLLNRWNGLGGQVHSSIAEQLYAVGQSFGRDATRGVVVKALNIEGIQIDRVAPIWAQTERLRAASLAAQITPCRHRAPFLATAVEAFQAIQIFLETPTRGLWRDRWEADGSFIVNYSPASSLYHIIGAYKSLIVPEVK